MSSMASTLAEGATPPEVGRYPGTPVTRTEVDGVGRHSPAPHMIAARMNPKRMLKRGPANAVIARANGFAWGSDLPSEVAGVSVGSNCGRETYPPNGSQLMTYSTPLYLNPQSFGPMPTEKVSTWRPCHRATSRWPNSWMKTQNPKKNTMNTIFRMTERISGIRK